MKNKKYIFIGIIFTFFLLIFSGKTYAGSQDMKNLTYEATLNEDGSMNVVETWNIKVEDTNTLFKTFKKDTSKYGGITNVTVKEIKNNEEIEFKKIYEEMYHVTKGCYYALDKNAKEFEIAWGVSIGNTQTKTYKISYKVENCIKVYADCSELYWQFLGTDNAMHVSKIKGTIKLPKAVDDIDNLRIWAHGPLNGEINKASNDTVEFKVDNLSSKTMLEVRVVTLEDIFPLSINNIDKTQFDNIISEETKWANEANAKRERYKLIIIAINIAFILLGVFFITKVIKYIKILKQVKKIVPQTKVEYYREIPDESATPADAAYLHYFSQGKVKANISKIFSATLLDLCLKKIISFEMENKEKAEEVKIVLLKDKDIQNLNASEKIVYEQLQKVAQEEGEEFSIKQLQKYIKKHSERFVKDLEKIEDITVNEQVKKENYDKEIAKKGSKYIGFVILYSVLAFFTFVFGIICGPAAIFTVVVLMINVVLCIKIASRYNGLTQKGVDEQELWQALKRYMVEFSLLKEREVPELVLWEKYLVFATTFGVADKVIKQLKIVYPQLSEEELVGDYAYMHMMTHSNFDIGFINSMNSAIASAYTSAYNSTYSSGSGAGGGFSGGGGGRWWRRPEWAEDKSKKHLKNEVFFCLKKIIFCKNSYNFIY